MRINLRHVVIFETLLIVVLFAALLYAYSDKKISMQANVVQSAESKGFLSKRVYTGVLEPENFMITNYQPLRTEIQ